MDRPRSLLLDYLIYLAIRILICLAQAFPLKDVLSLAGPIGWLCHRFDRRHRLVAEENVRHAFPHLSSAEVAALVRRCYDHFAEVMIEVAVLPRVLHSGSIRRHVRYPEGEEWRMAEAGLNSGRPLVVVTGHLGNWEVMNYALGLLGYRAHCVARSLDNPFLDRFIGEFRRKTGQKLVDKDGAFSVLRDVLRDGGNAGLVVDQDAGQRGFFVGFFGRPASTFRPPAMLSLDHDAMILVLAAVREGEGITYRVLVADLIDPREYAGRPDAAREITQRYTSALEAMVRRYPEQYFWLHRRWKHQPGEAREQRAA
jgi:KDO2-lipid IV(A) lauroyltransferase